MTSVPIFLSLGRSNKDPYPTTEEISAVRRGGGRDHLKNVLNLYRMYGERGGGGVANFLRGGGGVWIFSGTTHYMFLHVLYYKYFSYFMKVFFIT